MWRIPHVGWVCLFGVLASACVRQATPPRSAPPPPPPLPEGQQSLEDLDRTLSSGGPALVASVQRAERTSERWADVKVTVAGIGLVDPQMVGDYPVWGQGHLHYQVDGGPVIATTATKLSFHDLAPGSHTIVVLLAGNDHRPLGPKRVLTVTIPSDGKRERSKTRKRASAHQAPTTSDDKLSSTR